MHLTNYAINKDNPNFEFNEDENHMDIGNKRSMTSVMQVYFFNNYIFFLFKNKKKKIL